VNHSLFVLSAVAAITAGTPLVFASVGEILAERSGIMNLGVEGMMLLGAVMGIVGALATHNPWVGIAFAAGAGAALALIHAFLSVSLRANQIVSGLALVIVGTGLSAYIGQLPDDPLTERGAAPAFGPLLHGGLADLPVIGPIIFQQDAMVVLSWVTVALASFYLFGTKIGLSLRAVGEDPATADASGIRVGLVRYIHTVIGGALAGIGGAYLAIALTGIWQNGITAGAGWIAFALVSFSGWMPGRALVGAYVFGALTSLSFTLQLAGVRIPPDVLAIVPFVMTIVVLIVVSAVPSTRRRLSPPAALAVSYRREDR
jgi:simple sugar transport system permease protein